jgi:hypothetical protein
VGLSMGLSGTEVAKEASDIIDLTAFENLNLTKYLSADGSSVGQVADVGLSMGLSGTEVAKEASDIIDRSTDSRIEISNSNRSFDGFELVTSGGGRGFVDGPVGHGGGQGGLGHRHHGRQLRLHRQRRTLGQVWRAWNRLMM